MDWLEKLNRMLGSAGGAVGDVAGAVGNTLEPTLNPAMKALGIFDVPRKFVGRPFFGNAATIGTGIEALFAQAGLGELEPEDLAALQAYRDAFQGADNPAEGLLAALYRGGTESWEQMQADNPWLVQGALDIGADPFSYATLGASAGARIAGAGARMGGTGGLALRGAGQTIRGTGNVLRGGNWLIDKPLAMGGRGIAKITPQALRKPFQLTDESRARIQLERAFGSLQGLYGSLRTARGQTPVQEAFSGRDPSFAVPPQRVAPPTRQEAMKEFGQYLRSQLSGSLPIVNRPIKFGNTDIPGVTVTRIESMADLDQMAEIARDILLDGRLNDVTPASRSRAAREFIPQFQDEVERRMEVRPDEAATWTVYDYLRESGTVPNLPHTRWVGPNPVNALSAKQTVATPLDEMTDADQERWLANWGAGRLMPYVQGGDAALFGDTYGLDEFKGAARVPGVAGRAGEVVPDEQQFAVMLQREFGAGLDPEQVSRIYDKSLDKLKMALDTAGKPKVGSHKSRVKMPARIDDYVEAAIVGRFGKDWYRSNLLPLRVLFDDSESFRRFVGVWAANSPNMNLAGNAAASLAKWTETLTEIGGVIGPDGPLIKLTPEQISAIWDNVTPTLRMQGGMPGHRMNTARALEGLNLEGPKVADFRASTDESLRAQLVEQGYQPDPNAPVSIPEQEQLQRIARQATNRARSEAVMDLWHTRFNNLGDVPSEDLYHIQRSATQEAADYIRGASPDDEIIRDIAEQLGMDPQDALELASRANTTGISPADLQEVVWAFSRAMGKPSKNPAGISPNESQVLASFGESGAPMADTLLGRIKGQTLKGFGARHVANRIADMDASIRKVIQQARERGAASVDLDLIGPIDTGPTRLNASLEPPGGKTRTIERTPGIAVLSVPLAGQSDDDLVREIFTLKMKTQPLAERSETWFRTGYNLVQGEDGTMNLILSYHPKKVKWDNPIARTAQRHIRDRLSMVQDLDEQIRMVRQLADETDAIFRENDRYARNIEAGEYIRGYDGSVQTLDRQMTQVLDEFEVNRRAAIEEEAAKAKLEGRAPEPVFAAAGASYQPTLMANDKVNFRRFDPSRPVVGVASAGKEGKVRFNKQGAATGRDFLKRMSPLFLRMDDKDVVIGLYADTDNVKSFDVSFLAKDAEEAEFVARMLDQKGWYDPSTGSSHEIPGATGKSPLTDPEDIATFLDWVKQRRTLLDPPMPRSIASKLRSRQQGVGFLMNAPKFDLGQTLFGSRNLPQADPNAAFPDPNTFAPPNAGNMLNMRADSPFTSQEESDFLFNEMQITEGKHDGKSFGDAFFDEVDDLDTLKANLAANGFTWQQGAKWDEVEQIITDPALRKEAKRVFDVRDGLDPLHSDSADIAIEQLRQDWLKQNGIDFDRQSAWDTLMGFWKESALLSPRYHTQNVFGGILHSMLVRGIGALPGPAEYAATVQRYFTGKPADWMWKFDTSTVYEKVQKYGYHRPNESITKDNFMSQATEGAKTNSAKVLGRIFGKVGLALAKPAEWNRSFSQASDAVFRGTVWEDAMDAHFTQHAGELQNRIIDAARREGIDLTGQELLPSYDPGALYRHYRQMGMSEGRAANIARKAAELRNKANTFALGKVEKAFFSYKYRNIDEWVSKFVPFHYWASRAIRFYAEEAARNPIFLSTLYRAQEGLADMELDPGLSARQKGFVRLMQGPTGFSLLMNPDALFGVVKVLGIDNSYTPEGETELGGIMRRMKERGIGLYPWIDSTLNIMGTYGDTFEPDFLGIRHRALVGSVAQWLQANGVFGDQPAAGAGYAEAMGDLRGWVSMRAAEYLPQWLASPVQPLAEGSHSGATLDTIIANRIIAEHPEMTNEQLFQIMNDPESEEYQSAYQDAAGAGLMTQLLNFTLPVTTRVREDSRDVRTAQERTIEAAAEEAGVAPFDFAPQSGDLAFAAQYESQTGNQWKPDDYEKSISRRDLARAEQGAREFILLDQQYRSLGGPEAQKLLDRYNSIRSGDFTPYGLDPNMDEVTRAAVADRWLQLEDSAGVIPQVRLLQQGFRATHPEFDAFKVWQGTIFDIKAYYGSLQVYRDEVSRQNPNAAKYFADTVDYIRTNVPQAQQLERLDQMTTSPEAWFAITGRAMYGNEQQPISTGQYAADPAQTIESRAQRMFPQPPEIRQPQPQSWIEYLANYSRSR